MEISRYEKTRPRLPKGFDVSRHEFEFFLFTREFIVVRLTYNGAMTDSHILLMEKNDQRWCSIYVDLTVISSMTDSEIKANWNNYELALYLSAVAISEQNFDIYDVIETITETHRIMENF